MAFSLGNYNFSQPDIQSLDMSLYDRPRMLLSNNAPVAKEKENWASKIGNVLNIIGKALNTTVAAVPGPGQAGAQNIMQMDLSQREAKEKRLQDLQKMWYEMTQPKSEWGKMASDFGLSPSQIAQLKKSSSTQGDPNADLTRELLQLIIPSIKKSLTSNTQSSNKDENIGDFDIYGNPILKKGL